MSRAPLRLRRRAAIATGLACLLLASACGGGEGATDDQPGGPVTLTYWAWGPSDQLVVDTWNATHPNIQVKLEKIPAGNKGGYAKMHAAVQANNAPDLATVEFQMIPSFAAGQELVNLAEHGVDRYKSQFADWQWNQSVLGDGVYALPKASGPIALFYRKDVFDQLGLAAPATWADFEAAARKIRTSGGDRYIAAFPPGNAAWFSSLAWQAGAKWFGVNGNDWTVDLDDPNTLKVADYWQKLITDKLVKVEPDFAEGWYKDLQEGKVLAWPSAIWGGVTLEQQVKSTAGKWAIAPIPQWEAGRFVSANYGGATTAVLRGSKHPKQAMEFAAFVGGSPEGAEIQAQNYNWPPRTDLATNKNLNKPLPFFGNQPLGPVFSQSDGSVDKSWQWIPTIDGTYQAIADGFQRAVAGNGTLADAIRAADQKTVADLKAKGFTVAG
jgi:multiple sugar transport system substrate-binding protein